MPVKTEIFPDWYFISEMQFLDFYYSICVWFKCSFLFFSSLNNFITIPHLKMFFFLKISFSNHCKYAIHLLWLKIDLYCTSIAWQRWLDLHFAFSDLGPEHFSVSFACFGLVKGLVNRNEGRSAECQLQSQSVKLTCAILPVLLVCAF